MRFGCPFVSQGVVKMRKMVLKARARTMGGLALDLVVESMILGIGGGIVDESPG